MTIRFDDKVAIVTGAGGGLGRCHALALAERGAKVVVNDLGGALDGSGGSSSAAKAVVKEIVDVGGQAIANGSSVTDVTGVQKLVDDTLDAFGKIDILMNNAGILRDKSFGKMELDDFAAVVDVHLMGTVKPTKAVWPHMKEQQYGRILVTTSSSGLFGNFGQSNYGAAKLALVGLMNTLRLEGTKDNIRINALAPVAATRMTEDLMPKEMLDLLRPEYVSPGALVLVSEEAPSGEILCAGAGSFAKAQMIETGGVFLGHENLTPEMVKDAWDDIGSFVKAAPQSQALDQSQKLVGLALAAAGNTSN